MIPVPSTENINRIADWVELYLISSNKTISKSKINSLFQLDGIDIDEEDIDSVIQELSRRLLLYGNKRPYEINGNKITPNLNWELYPGLTLCLFYSTYGAGNPDEGTKMFEQITKFCLQEFFQGQGYIFGFPNEKSFVKQLDEFADLIHEDRYENPLPTDKDRGVDLIIYKMADDIRYNTILYFVQCAAGKNWDEKKPVAIDSYRRYFSFTLKATLSSIALTQIVEINEWRNACDDYGIIMDRARLYKIMASRTKPFPKELTNKIKIWCQQKLGK